MEQKRTTFYSAFLSMLNVEITRSIPTAATDGLKIMYNPEFLDQLSNEEILGLTLHEIEHPINGHCDYALFKNFCEDKLNIAQDHYINLRITAMGYKIPGPPLCDPYCDPQYKGMSSMEIYHKLPKNGPKMKIDLKDILPCPEGMSKEEHAERVLNTIVKSVIIAEQANDAGSIPGDLQRDLQDILSPQLPWNTILQQYLTEYVSEDYSMRRPNRRFMPGWYLPTLQGEGLGHVFEYCDVSGSMSQEDVSEIWSEFTYIFETMNPISIHIMTGDTKIHLDKTYEQGDYIPEFEYTGGGGTVFEPVIERIREQQPVFALLFTDGYFSMPDLSGIDTDIFWIIKGNPEFKAPMGEVIHFE
jgi:predicted metal-dependent peptidase